MNKHIKNKWSRSQVELQFKAKAYERYLIDPDTSIQDREVSINSELNEIVKDTYVLDFIGVNDITSEKKLQNSILSICVSPFFNSCQKMPKLCHSKGNMHYSK